MTEKYLETIVQYLISFSANSSENTNNINDILSKLNDVASNQVKQSFLNPTHLGVVNEGDNTFDQNVVLCNITNSNITISVIAADDTEAQQIILTPGWNPVIVKQVISATANTLIYGW